MYFDNISSKMAAPTFSVRVFGFQGFVHVRRMGKAVGWSQKGDHDTVKNTQGTSLSTNKTQTRIVVTDYINNTKHTDSIEQWTIAIVAAEPFVQILSKLKLK